MGGKQLGAVIFDMDGVITDSARFHFAAWKELADSLGISIDLAFNEKLKGVSRMESLDLILAHGGRTGDFTTEEREAMAAQKNELYKKLIGGITPEDALPGILLFLNELRAAGIPTGVASVSHNAPAIIQRLEIGHLLDHVVDPAAVKRMKPWPDLFLAAAQALGVQSGQCIGIEDARAGITAIKAAGMFAVGVGTPAEMEGADLVLPGTACLNLALLQKAFAKED